MKVVSRRVGGGLGGVSWGECGGGGCDLEQDWGGFVGLLLGLCLLG